MTMMTNSFDRFFISQGLDATDLVGVKSRVAFYAAFSVMALAGLGLIAGIVANIVG